MSRRYNQAERETQRRIWCRHSDIQCLISAVSLRPRPPGSRAQNPCWRVGLLSGAPAEGSPLPAGHRIPVGGWVCCRERSRTPPTHQQGTESLLAGGFTVGSAIARLPTPPTHQQGTHPCQGCCPCARWAHANIPRVSDQPSPHSYLIL